MFVAQINIIFMRPLYEAVILCGCIIISYMVSSDSERMNGNTFKPTFRLMTPDEVQNVKSVCKSEILIISNKIYTYKFVENSLQCEAEGGGEEERDS